MRSIVARIRREIAAGAVVALNVRGHLKELVIEQVVELEAWAELLREASALGVHTAVVAVTDGAGGGEDADEARGIVVEALGVEKVESDYTLPELVKDLSVEHLRQLERAVSFERRAAELADQNRGLIAELGLQAAAVADAVAALAERIGAAEPPLSKGGRTLEAPSTSPALVINAAIACLDARDVLIEKLRAEVSALQTLTKETAAMRRAARVARDEERVKACRKVACPPVGEGDGCGAEEGEPCVARVIDAAGVAHVTNRAPHKARWALAKEAGKLPASLSTGEDA